VNDAVSSPYLLLNSVADRHWNDSVCMIATARNFLTEAECQQVCALGEKSGFGEGTIGMGKDTSVMRSSDVTCLAPGPETMWLFNKLDAAITKLNESYQYDLLGFFEGVQVAKYSSGGKYDWHMDIGAGENSSRKLSLSLQLSRSDDYSGGNLEFQNIGKPGERAMGTLIAFPSFLQHRVTPVARGVRVSLVAWVHGRPFR
jgi:PKHD-type hydroxylase